MTDEVQDHNESGDLLRASDIPDAASKYEALVADVGGVVSGQRDKVANMANAAAVIFETLNGWTSQFGAPGEQYTNWAGFYRVDLEARKCILGPFQGGAARATIPFGKGVVGSAAEQVATQLVPNVHEFPGHIACDCASESEIVVPVLDAEGKLVAVIDIDSPHRARFTDIDKVGIEAVAAVMGLACDW